MNSELFGIFAVLGVFLFIVIAILIAWLVFYIIGMWKLYQKMGNAGWECIVPVYSTWVLVKNAGLNVYWFVIITASSIVSFFSNDSGLILLCSAATIITNICIYYNLSKKFNKDTNWLVLAVIFSGIVLPITGYSKTDEYVDVEVTPNGIFDKDKVKNTNSETKNETINNSVFNDSEDVDTKKTSDIEGNKIGTEKTETINTDDTKSE